MGGLTGREGGVRVECAGPSVAGPTSARQASHYMPARAQSLWYRQLSRSSLFSVAQIQFMIHSLSIRVADCRSKIHMRRLHVELQSFGLNQN